MFDGLRAWTMKRLGVDELTEPMVLHDGSVWLRLAPNEPPRWFPTQLDAVLFGNPRLPFRPAN